LRASYRVEAGELLGELEQALLELEQRPADEDLIGRVFRALHTIKGSGAMFGFEAVAAFTHNLENAYDRVRSGEIGVSAGLIGVTLAARDHIQALLGDNGEEQAALRVAGELLLQRLGEVVQTKPVAAAAPPVKSATPARTRPEEATYRIRFEPHADLLLTGANPALLLAELRELGELSVIAHVEEIPQLESFDFESCYTQWDAVLTTAAGIDAVRDVFIFVEEHARVTVERVEEGEETPRLGDLLVERGVVTPTVVEGILQGRPKVGEALVEAGAVTHSQVKAALVEQQHRETLRAKRQAAEQNATLRVPAAKLDTLVNIVGELVTVQARLSGYALAAGESEIGFIAEEVERLTEMLRESTMSIRMLPIGETFARFRRLVRDLSGELGKQVELEMEGNETELDKTVIEQLSDPLVHLVRNAVDHGIETPEKRRAAGKSPVGHVKLTARHSGAFVLIQIQDDGAGLDRAAIRRRAIERGLIQAEAVMTDAQLDALILAPGFSTAEQVTEISGRGVGMDVVKRSLEALRGTLTVSSTPGQGSVMSLKIPLTLAIIDGLLVEAGGSYFVIPLSNISECIELKRGETLGRGSLVTVRNELVPYVVLRERFSIAGEAPAIEQVIIAETQEGRYGFVVDRVIGDHHTVIKKLGSLYRHIDELSGATILGDGTVALILDVDKVVASLIREGAQE